MSPKRMVVRVEPPIEPLGIAVVPPRQAPQAGQEGHGALAASGAPRALTVKLAPDLYRRLRLHAVTHDTTHQKLMVAALLEYLERHK